MIDGLNRKKYLHEFQKALSNISKTIKNKEINHEKIAELELDKRISQYGIDGANLKNLNFAQKEKFYKFIEQENFIKKEISDNYNKEYFIRQDRLKLERFLKYKILIEIDKYKKIVNNNLIGEISNKDNPSFDLVKLIVDGPSYNVINNNSNFTKTKNKASALRKKIEEQMASVKNNGK
ncbi:MAG: hypothetical protein ACRCW6_00625 [Mycoplasmoidaceae bacterium]